MRMGQMAIAEAEQGKDYGRLLLGHTVNLTGSVRQTDRRCQGQNRSRVLSKSRVSSNDKRSIDTVFDLSV